MTRGRSLAFLLAVMVFTGGIAWWQYIRSAPVRQHIEEGTRLLQAGQNAQAEREWLQAVQIDPTSAEAWDLLGDFYLAFGKWQQAQDAFHHVLALRPDTPALHARLATCAFRLGDTTKARKAAEEALTVDRNDATALQLLAEIAKTSGLHDEQLQYLRRLVESKPHDVKALTALADELARRAEYKESLGFIERALVGNPDWVPALYLRGLVLFSDDPAPEQLKKAAQDFKRVLELDPVHIESHRYLARVYMRFNQPAQAIPHFEAVGRGRPYASAHWLELANAYRKTGKTIKANQLRQLFYSLKQENRQIMDVRDRLAQNPDSFKDNLAMGQLLFKSVTSTETSYQLYAYRFAKGELAGVEFHARKALAAQPDNLQAKALLLKIEKAYVAYLKAGQQEEKRQNYERAKWQFGHAILLRPEDKRTLKLPSNSSL